MWCGLKSVDGIFNFKAFASRTLARSNFEVGQNRVIDEGLNEAALFVVVSADDPKTSIQSVKDGGLRCCESIPAQ